MKWSEKDFRARVKAHAERQGITLTEVLKRARLTEDYFRHPPEVGRNIAGILKIADALQVGAAELMGLELSSEERRSTLMIAQVIGHLHFHVTRANGNGVGADEIEKTVVAVMAALKQYEPPPTAKPQTPAAARARPRRSG